MKQAAADVFERFVAAFPTGDDACLFAERPQAPDAAALARAPFWTVLVRGRHDGQEGPHALVLLTLPSRAPDAPEVLEFAVRRARAHKAPYLVTWTMRDAILWRTPKPGVPVARDSLEKLRDYPDLYEVGAADNAVIDENIKLRILSRGGDLRADLTKLLKDEALELVRIDATYFVNRLLDAVHHLLPIVAESVHYRLAADIAFRDQIAAWAAKQGIAGSPSDAEFAESITRQIIYRLLGKVLFYQSLRRSARQLPKLDFDRADSSEVLPGLRAAFAEALKIDYHAVFEEDLPDRVTWPAQASRELAALIHDFNTRDFASLPQDVIGTVFERLIPPEERHGLGQYFTSEDLCDLINAFCITSANDRVLDPTCGTGTFLIRAYDRLRWLGQTDHAALLSQIWGIDIAPFPAELATINLFRQRIAEHGNFPRIICGDFFRVEPGQTFRFPPPKMDLEHPEEVEQTIPQFDAIVGNFPYVSADQIEKHEAGYLGFLRECLIADWLDEYPQLFRYTKKSQQAAFEKLAARGEHSGTDRATVQHRISTYADLYIHLFFHTARFLKPGGRMGIVTSNAWLDVNYGYELQEFFLNHFRVIAVLESRCEPWFTEASVNTVVTIVERCANEKERNEHLVKFVKVKKPLAELMPDDPIISAATRWQSLAKLVAHIENAARKDRKTHPLGLVTEEDDRFRIRVLRQGEMLADLRRNGKTVKWGRYLRAPQVFFDLLGTGKLPLLGEVATPKFGSKTRINEFFHVTPQAAAEFGIETEYLLPLIKSPKESDTIHVDSEELKLRIFVCRRTKEELRKLHHYGALRYIEWGEQQRYSRGAFKGAKWPEGTWVALREPAWYALPPNETQMSHIYFSEAYHERHLQRYSPAALVADNVLCFLTPDEEEDTEILVAALNSTIAHLAVELTGRVTLGDGVLRLKVEEAREYLPIPGIVGLKGRQREQVLAVFQRVLERPAERAANEVRCSDRQVFDKAVFAAIGLDAKTYMKPLYAGLCELVGERLGLARLRNSVRRVRERGTRAEKKAAEDVLDELLPNGPLRFPDEFLSSAAVAGAKTTIELPNEPLIFDQSPLFTGVHTADHSFSRNVKPPEGRYLVYAQRAGHQSVQIPAKMVEVTRAVANYERYLRELREQLYEAYFLRTLDTRAAARLTQAALDRFRLPTPESIE